MGSLVVIDASLASDQNLLASLPADAAILVLDPGSSGVDQIIDYLESNGGADSLHIISHGSPGSLMLGDSLIDSASLKENADTWQQLGQLLMPGADILLYGCDIAAGPAGQRFLSLLHRVTGVDVAASNDLTGSGGDWDLETTRGQIETMALDGFSGYVGTLGFYPGTPGADELWGSSSADTMAGGDGNDTLWGGGGDDVLAGGAGNDKLYGEADNDSLFGDTGNDTLDGGAGSDSMAGGTGNDLYYVDSRGDIVTEAADAGTDTVLSYLWSYTLGSNVEIGRIMSTSADLFGNALNNTLIGGAGNDVLYGWEGDDRVDGEAGNDNLYGGGGNDWLYGGEGNDWLSGGDGNDWLSGGAGSDTLSGGSGSDSLIGGTGNDLYVVDNIGDIISETSTLSTEIDTVQSSVTWTLGANLENLTLLGTDAINGTGNTLNNKIIGNNANNILFGGSGKDTIDGGAGFDMADYRDKTSSVVVNLQPYISILKNPYQDVFVNDVLEDKITNIEGIYGGSGDDQLTGCTLDNMFYGNEGNDSILGMGGNDTIYGGWGEDTIQGGDGNDILYGDNKGFYIINPSNADYIDGEDGNDLIYGGIGSDTLLGGTGNDTLNGGSGSDSLIGGTGNDTYVVDSVADIISETSTLSTEIDTVESSVTWTLGENLENLTLLGTDAINGTGNTLDNMLIGNSANNSLNGSSGNDTLNGGTGNDTLNGGSGSDSLIGGTGNDTYVVNSIGDIISETSTLSTEIDTVRSSVTWTLGSNLEHLILTGTTAINGTGNGLNNKITGNAANNSLVGGSGNDTLVGGAGNDTLNGGSGSDSMAGGTGNDIYYVNATGDIVTEAASEGADTVYSYLGAYTLGSNVEHGRIMPTTAANLTGNALNNTLYAGVGNNVLQGGSGIDTVSYAYGVSGTTGVTVNLGVTTAQVTGGSGSDTFASIENVTGSANADRLTGNSGNNALNGGKGNDTLVGAGGNDNLIGGAGSDSMTGGAGNDRFTFNSALGSSNIDIITDFVHGTDKIVLDDDIFTQIGALGTLSAGAFRKGAGVTTAGDADDRIILNTTTGALYYDANGNAAGAAVQFATLTGTSTKTTITASDFLVVS